MSVKTFDFWCKVHKYFSIKDTIELFIDILKDCTEDAFKILYLTRDYKNGKGLKKHSVAILTYLRFVLDNDTLKILYTDIIKYGYWKDLLNTEIVYYELTKKTESLIPKIFAEQLDNDITELSDHKEWVDLNEEKKENLKISLCAKWTPSEYSFYNKSPYLLTKRIAAESKICTGNLKTYRKNVSKLRSYLEIVEKMMSTKEYNKIDFNKVPFICFKKNKEAFNRSINCKDIKSDDRLKLAKEYNKYLNRKYESDKNGDITLKEEFKLKEEFREEKNKEKWTKYNNQSFYTLKLNKYKIDDNLKNCKINFEVNVNITELEQKLKYTIPTSTFQKK